MADPLAEEPFVLSDATAPTPYPAIPGVPPLIQEAAEQFREDLPELLATRRSQWVIYHGRQKLGFGSTKTDLYLGFRARGYSEVELYVRKIQEQLDDISVEW
jgi:hypothetical protein